MNPYSDNEDVLEEITNMESKFYKEGYESGYAHGKLHGLFEGRELGREKAWELWEEVGYYQGWANVYVSLLNGNGNGNKEKEGRKGKDARALNHAQILLSLIETFPIENPSSTPIPIPNSSSSSLPVESSSAPLDLAGLLSNIRARYKLLCSSLGQRPRLQVAHIVEAIPGSGASGAAPSTNQQFDSNGDRQGVVQGIEGPMKGVDTRQLRF
ncbi:uncharacterized protein IL334_005997 [Kwoniella shivajii]|uniref:Essential protein Yae1 N-terminal domain-containing protein n=1 Tax=Kwoniella shivajii TaxID=564305 RepID=A0ABZ1D530_9TREE|nr:hypothetical protein IL334_005997 [Kwoniella shivajii]